LNMLDRRRYKKASSRIAKRGKIKRIFVLFLKIGLPVTFLIGLIFLLRANFLQVKSFEILGAETIQQTDIKNAAANFIAGNNFFIIPKSNILFLNKENLSKVLLSKFDRLEKVKIIKHFLNGSVELSLTERKADFLWCSETDSCFFMSKDGLVFEQSDIVGATFEASKVFGIEPLNKIIFRGILTGDPLMKNFATPAEIENYLKLIKIFNDAGFDISSINIETSDRAVAKSSTGDIIFNPDEADLSEVAQNTILLIKETKSKNPTARFNYIDARFGNKLFYKLY
jgi:hypothetical protein